MTTLPEKTDKKLGLVIDLNVCVGLDARGVSRKHRGARGYGAALSDQNSVTAQAAWNDLRVKIEKAEDAEASEPRLGTQRSPVKKPTEHLTYGDEW